MCPRFCARSACIITVYSSRRPIYRCSSSSSGGNVAGVAKTRGAFRNALSCNYRGISIRAVVVVAVVCIGKLYRVELSFALRFFCARFLCVVYKYIYYMGENLQSSDELVCALCVCEEIEIFSWVLYRWILVFQIRGVYSCMIIFMKNEDLSNMSKEIDT